MIPQGIGGRLAARILCNAHNNKVNKLADEALVKGLAFLVHAFKVPLHRGKTGTELHGVSKHGYKFTIDSTHVPRQKKQLAKDHEGRITRFTAPSIEAVHGQLKTMGLSLDDPDIRLMEIMSEAPGIYFIIAFVLNMCPGVVKIAYHFTATQGAHTSREVSTRMLDMLANAEACANIIFPLAPRSTQHDYGHEVVAYPARDDTIVTVGLFGIYQFGVLLKDVFLPRAVRCYQDIQSGSVRVEPTNAEAPTLTPLDDSASAELNARINMRLTEAFQFIRQRDALKLLEKAHLRAFALACKEDRPTQERFLILLEQELALNTAKRDLIAYLMDLARKLPPMPAPPY